MKKYHILILVFILLFTSINLTKARQDSRLSIFIEKPFFGETSSYRFLIEYLPFKLETETISLTFPSNYQLPTEIPSSEISLGSEVELESVSVLDSRIIQMKAKFNGTQHFDVKFSQNAGIVNPLEWTNSSVFAVQFISNSFVAVSSVIPLRSPNNTVLISPSYQTLRDKVWLDQAIELELRSSTAREIRYSLKQGTEQVYQNPIKLDEGIHELVYFGIRENGAKESPKSEKFYIDLTPPQVKIISPQKNDLTNKATVEVLFEIKDLSPVRLFIDQAGEYLVPEDGLLKIKLELKPGRNVFNYKALDSANHEFESSITLFLDITPPYLVIFSPQFNEVICTSKVDITGKAEVDSQVWIGDIPVKLDAFGNFTLQWTPLNGKNQLQVRALDKAGNETRRDLQFMVFPGLVIEASIGQTQAQVNGVEKEINPAPFVDRKSNEVYFPLRFIAETLSYELQWVAQGSYVSMKKSTWEIRVRSLDPIVQIRNQDHIEDVRLQYVPTVYQGSMMVSAEFIKRILAGDILLDTSSKKVIIHFCEKTVSQETKK
jgi:hypothetical protein